MTRVTARDADLKERAARVIPGGMYGHESTKWLPDEYPQFFSRADGARLWDVDDNEYIDFICAFGPNLLGYNNPKVQAAAARQQALGDTLTGPSAVMVELAERFVGMVSHADWAMFCKNGSDATSTALMVARAHTGRSKIILARGTYHGSHTWNTPVKAGITPEDRANLIYCEYNDPQSLRDAAAEAGTDLAGIFATAFRHEVFRDQALPDPEYAATAREICDETGALLIVDDVRAGFRLARDCSWSTIGVQPDLSAWGKVIANGHPISALLGSDKAREAAQRIFVTGSFWFSAVPMAAACATLAEIRDSDYLERIERIGTALRHGLQQQAASHGYVLRQTGPVQMPQILFEDDPDFRRGFCWTAEAVKRGVYLHPFHNMFICAAHSEDDVRQTLAVTDEAFEALRRREPTLGPVDKLAAFAEMR
jgi:glutamate-1-semialdehyde 2,1-aminomutase